VLTWDEWRICRPEQVEDVSGADRARADAEWGGTPSGARHLRRDVARSATEEAKIGVLVKKG
jgi:hypothetical protein